MCLIGYGDRQGGATSVHDNLTATALVVDDGTTQAAILAVDILGLNWQVVERAKRGIEAATGIPAGNVRICCSHTHSGPVGYAPERIGAGDMLRHIRNRALLTVTGPQPRGLFFNKQYIDGLVEKLIAAVREAQERLTPATVGWARGESDIGHNRRERTEDGRVIIGHNPHGPIDRTVTVVHFRGDEGPLATVVNFACHPTILGPTSYAISADWVGVMRSFVEAEVSGLCLFVQGAAGDINPQMEWSANDWPEVALKGGAVGAEVARRCKGTLRWVEGGPITAINETVWAKLEVASAEPGQRPPGYRERLSDLSETELEMPPIPLPFVDPVLDTRYPWKTVVRERYEVWETPIPIGALRLGGIVLASVAMEPFTETGLAVKAVSPAEVTLFAGYTDGLTGYLPTPEEHALGGYEVELAPYFYRLPGIFQAESEPEVLAAMKEVVGKVMA